MLEAVVKALVFLMFVISYIEFVFKGELKDGIFVVLGLLFVLSIYTFAITAKVCVD